ncbi:MAG TPA: maleylpyruvate isomerase family mycothiol-dependent enzyme [Acidimicrobiales bacterium]|nr:maleylpyruvate isomerase family mycothiol-dependent enzyme [Acidimicrobiales bacterium]
MDEVVAALREQQEELGSLLDGLDDDGWAAPSRCAGWTVCDVVLHLGQTNEMAIASVHGRFEETAARLAQGLPPAANVDEGVDALVARERGLPPAAVHERYRRSSAELCEALRSCDPGARVTWVAGELAAQTLATTRLAETWIHTGDVFHAFGRTPEAGDRLWHIARLAWRSLPYAFARDGRTMTGPVAFRLVGPGGDAWDFDDDDAPTRITGDALDLCMVASRRTSPDETGLRGEGPDAAAVLELVRTWA